MDIECPGQRQWCDICQVNSHPTNRCVYNGRIRQQHAPTLVYPQVPIQQAPQPMQQQAGRYVPYYQPVPTVANAEPVRLSLLRRINSRTLISRGTKTNREAEEAATDRMEVTRGTVLPKPARVQQQLPELSAAISAGFPTTCIPKPSSTRNRLLLLLRSRSFCSKLSR